MTDTRLLTLLGLIWGLYALLAIGIFTYVTLS